ncbi:hypothetical protein C8F01DRAFT_178907 [Mycena amicta]|nr:hypothetical protein C8F01DRAFT_178907 [Mycena amicta]
MHGQPSSSSFDATGERASYRSPQPGPRNREDPGRAPSEWGPDQSNHLPGQYPQQQHAQGYGGHLPGQYPHPQQGYGGRHIWSESNSRDARQLDQDEVSGVFQDWDWSYGVGLLPEQSTSAFAPGFPSGCGWDLVASYQPFAPPTAEGEVFRPEWSQEPVYETDSTVIISLVPTSEAGPGPESGVYEQEVASSPSPEDTVTEATSLQQEKQGKGRQQKMHPCGRCGKAFPRPSGLRTHMNSHNNERPYTCKFPGCGKSFSVLSNAKRHYRTHGVEPPSSLRASVSVSGSSSKRPQYAVNFEKPITPTLPPPSVTSQAPFCVRWIEPNSASRGSGWGPRQTQQDVNLYTGAPGQPVGESS